MTDVFLDECTAIDLLCESIVVAGRVVYVALQRGACPLLIHQDHIVVASSEILTLGVVIVSRAILYTPNVPE